jgi:hypothetical protein
MLSFAKLGVFGLFQILSSGWQNIHKLDTRIIAMQGMKIWKSGVREWMALK